MRPIFIKGFLKYKSRIRKSLKKSSLNEGIDYIEGFGESDYALIWISDNISLKNLKMGITAKYIWKHRLEFFNSIEEMNPTIKNDEFTEDEKKLLIKIRENYSNFDLKP